MSKFKMRSLFALVDTEGGITNQLWQSTILVNAIVDRNRRNEMHFVEDVFHLIQFSSEKNMQSKTCFSSNVSAINFLLKKHECEEIILAAWNAGHDSNVLSSVFSSELNNKVKYVDLIPFVRNLELKDVENYKLNSLLNMYSSRNQKHKSFQDVLDLEYVMKCVLLESKGVKRGDVGKQVGCDKGTFVQDLITHEKSKYLKWISNRATLSIGVAKTNENYEYFKQDEIEYKVRKGWREAVDISGTNICEGYGIYFKNEETDEWFSIRDLSKKKLILVGKLALEEKAMESYGILNYLVNLIG